MFLWDSRGVVYVTGRVRRQSTSRKECLHVQLVGRESSQSRLHFASELAIKNVPACLH